MAVRTVGGLLRYMRCLGICLVLSTIPLGVRWGHNLRPSLLEMPLTKIYTVMRSRQNNGTALNFTGNLNTSTANFSAPCPGRIPRILHLTFATEHVYDNYKPYLKRCLELNPDWRVYLWRDSDSDQFIKKFYPSFAAKFNSYRGDLQKSDAVRYAVLHQFGGEVD